MVNTRERLLNVVTQSKPKMLTGLSQNGTVAGRGFLHGSLVDSQRHRQTERTSPILVSQRNTVNPMSSEQSVGSRKACQRDSGQKMAEKAKAIPPWEG